MIFNLSPLITNELNAMKASARRTAIFQWKAVLHIGNNSWPVASVDVADNKRDYLLSWADMFSISIKLDPVLFSTYIYPNRDRLEVQLTKCPKFGRDTGTLDNNLFQTMRFKASLYATSSPMVAQTSEATNLLQNYDKGSLQNYSLQLYDKIVDQVRTRSYGTNHRNSTGISALLTALKETATTAGDDNSYAIRGIDVAPGASDDVRTQIIIDHGTPLCKVPDVINKKSGGLYNTGFNHFIQNGIWYLFSPYNTKLYPQARGKTLTVINVPPTALSGIEATHRDTGNQLIIVATGNTSVSDQSERSAMNHGTGSRFVDANAQLEKSTNYQDGKVDATPKQFVSEFISAHRPDKMDLISGGATRITANYRLEYSKMAERQGMYVGVVWEYAIPELIYPGMPVKYVYMDNGKPSEHYGTVVGIHSKDHAVSDTPTDKIYATTAFLKLFIERKAST